MKNNKFLLFILTSVLLIAGCAKKDISNNNPSFDSVNDSIITNSESLSNSSIDSKLSENSNQNVDVTSIKNSSISNTSNISNKDTSSKNSTTSASTSNKSTSNSITSTYSGNVTYPDSTYSGTYYNGINLNQTGEALKTTLHKLISVKTVGSYDYAWTVYKDSDTDSNGKLIDIYSSKRWDQNANKGNYSKEGDAINREHCVPQSVFNEQTPMKADCHHLFPSDGYVNNRRSNYPFGYVTGTPKYQFVDKLGTYKLGTGSDKNYGYTGTVFEPIDEYKGDIARATLYMTVCYQDKISSWGNYDLFAKNTYPSLSNWGLKVLLEWCTLDPVSQREIDRNNGIYKHQNNRNPFVDHPSLVYKIWDPNNSIIHKDPQEEADKICDLISAIGNVSIQSEDKINAARNAYDNASSEVKALISNYNILVEAEAKFKELKDIKSANEVDTLINNIGEVSIENRNKIENARKAYDALNDDAKALVKNLNVLVEKENALKPLIFQLDIDECIRLINAIGTVSLQSENAIKAAREAYDKLSSEQKEKLSFDIKATLLRAESDFAKLKEEHNSKVGSPIECTFTDSTFKNSANLTFTSSPAVFGYLTDGRGVQFNKNNEIIIKTSSYTEAISKITLKVSTNCSSGYSLQVSVGGTSFTSSDNLVSKADGNNKILEFNIDAPTSGEIIIKATITSADKSFMISYVGIN